MPLIRHIEPPPGCRVRFLSDLHLAHKRSTAPAPAMLMEQMQGIDMLVLCGDTAEVRSCGELRARSEALRNELRRLCRERGVELVEIAGNHDSDIETMLASFWGGRVVAMHGHELLKTVSPWGREYLENKDAIRALIAAHPEAEHDLAAALELTRLITCELERCAAQAGQARAHGFLHELYHCFWPPERPFSIVWNWLTCASRAEKWMRRYLPNADTLIIGHFHRPGRRQIGKRLILNTGAWFEHATPYAVDMQDGKLIDYKAFPKSAQSTSRNF